MEEIPIIGTTENLKNLVDAISERIHASAWGFDDDLKKLQITLEMILTVIADAEKRQEKEEHVRHWLRWLKDVAYDVDDVIDEFSYEDMRQNDETDNWKQKVNVPPAFGLKMAKNIKDVNKKLDEITKDMGRFQLQITAPAPDGESTEQLDRQATSHANESEIVGRECDESHIMRFLTTNTTSASSSVNSNRYLEKVSAMSIVGIAGVGKTALAELVYKHELVKEVFELTIWVHVSEIFDTVSILVNILESITKTKLPEVSNLDLLTNMVQILLSGKKYLLVLDDLWNEDAEQCDKLKSVLLVGAPGSKILITTRKDHVASIVRGIIPPYRLNQLEDDECWSIIKQKAFSPGGGLDTPEMSEIGKEIAKKCCGIPLAAKFLGGLMYFKNKECDWISIRDDDMWGTPESKRKILSVIKLSYNYLPSHLKQCFSYCSIFPKNWEIRKDTLVHLWMAEGFLKQSDFRNKRSTEDIGRDYFESLAWASFFQDFKKNDLGDTEMCKMHDLVHDLAEDVLGENELVSMKGSEFADCSGFRRLRLYLDEDTPSTFLKSSSEVKDLRTIFIPRSSKLDPSIFSGYQHLRVLHVGGSPSLSYPKLPSLSLELRHLRYLHLSSLDLRELVNDQCISQLYNLEILVLTCMLGVSNLLADIHSLQKLSYLELSWTDMEELPDSVTILSNLQTLNLNHSKLNVIPDNISGLKSLRFLDLSFNPIQEFPLSILTLSNLETIDVNSCKKLKDLPRIVAGLSNLRIFDFKNCPLIEVLPEDFGSLRQLRCLNLVGTQIKVLPESCHELGNLEIVDLFLCRPPREARNWKKVVSSDTESANLEGKHNLHELSLQWGEESESSSDSAIWGTVYNQDLSADVLETLVPPTSLKRLFICNYKGLILPSSLCLYYLPNLEVLELEACTEIRQFPEAIGKYPCLRVLKLKGIALQSLDLGGFPSLVLLHLSDMSLLEELRYSSYPTCLKDLWINGCVSLKEIPSLPSLTFLELHQIDPQLVCSVGKSQTSLRTLCLVNIEELIYFPMSILRNNHNLQVLQVKECNRFQGFRVIDDENEMVDDVLYGPDVYSGSLQQLGFIDCPVIQFLPDLRGWKSLRSLSILNCPKLESLSYDLESLSFIKELYVDEEQGDPSSSSFKGKLLLPTEGKNELLDSAPELDSSLVKWKEKFIAEMERERSPSNNKWRPTPGQESILELIEKCGVISPTMQQIEQITKQLGEYGKIDELDVSVWFQRRKPEEKREQEEQWSSSLMDLFPTSKEGLKYDNTGKMLPINSRKQREFLPSVKENIEVWASHYVRPKIIYEEESPPKILSPSANSTQGEGSRPEGQGNNETSHSKRSMQQPETPAGIGEFETLSYSVTKERGIEELGNLNLLKSLVISDLQNVDSSDAERAYLKRKHNLHELSLQWGEEPSGIWETIDYQDRSSGVLEALQPPTSLKRLFIRNFKGWSLPTWMCILSLWNLEVLEFEACTEIRQLPEAIGKLQCLGILKLKGMALRSLDLGGFPSLNELHLSDMLLLRELRYSSYPPCLMYLRISGCTSLKELPWLPSLTFLDLQRIHPKLLRSVGVERSQTSLTQLIVENIEDLIYFPMSILNNNSNIQILQIGGCNQFEGFDAKDMFLAFYDGSLQELKFIDCPVLKFLPELGSWTSLRVLYISNCPKVKENLTYNLKESLSFLEELKVDFLEIDEQQGDASCSFLKGELPLSTEGKHELAVWIKELLRMEPEWDSFLDDEGGKLEWDQSRSKNKWRLTVEQEGILELLYECGLRYPSVQQIQRITKKLYQYEKTEELNVYLWFQRHKNVYLWFQRHKPEERQEQTSSSLLARIPMITQGSKITETPMSPRHSKRGKGKAVSVEKSETREVVSKSIKSSDSVSQELEVIYNSLHIEKPRILPRVSERDKGKAISVEKSDWSSDMPGPVGEKEEGSDNSMYDSTGKGLPINSGKQRKQIPNVEENIDVRANIIFLDRDYLEESNPNIPSQQETTLPAMSALTISTHMGESQPEGQDNKKISNPKKRKRFNLFPWWNKK